MSPTLTSKTFNPIVVTSLVNISYFALTPGITLISITIPYTSWLSRVTGCHFLWLLNHHSLLHILLSQTHNTVLPPDSANVIWSPSLGQSSCSDSALQATVMSWGYVILIWSYEQHIELCNCLQIPWERWALKCSWTFTFSVFPWCNL